MSNQGSAARGSGEVKVSIVKDKPPEPTPGLMATPFSAKPRSSGTSGDTDAVEEVADSDVLAVVPSARHVS